MGKNRIIKIIANLIAKATAHKILVKYTNRPNTIHHMSSEVDNYRGMLSEHILEYNWNIQDKETIKKEAQKYLIKELEKDHFNDVNFPDSEKDEILDRTIVEFFN